MIFHNRIGDVLRYYLIDCHLFAWFGVTCAWEAPIGPITSTLLEHYYVADNCKDVDLHKQCVHEA